MKNSKFKAISANPVIAKMAGIRRFLALVPLLLKKAGRALLARGNAYKNGYS